MTRNASALLAGVVLAGLSGVGVALFSTFGATANPFGGNDPGTCGPSLTCSADTFTATEASSGPAFAVSSVLTCAVDFGPGANDCFGTNGSGFISAPAGTVLDIGSTRIQDAQVVVTNGAVTCDGNCEIRDSGNGTLPFNTTGGFVFNGTSAITGFLIVAVTIDIAQISASTCDDVTATVAGVNANDFVSVTPNFDMLATDVSVSNAHVTNAGTDEVTFRACNLDIVSPQDPASGSYLFWVVRKA